MCQRLLEQTGVAILPGSDFGRPAAEFTSRLAYVDFDGTRALAAAEHIPPEQPLNENFIRTHCGRSVTAVDRLCDWMRSPK